MKKPYLSSQQRRFMTTCNDNKAAIEITETISKLKKIKKIKKWWKRFIKKYL